MLHPCKGVLGVLQGYCTLGTSSFTLFFYLSTISLPAYTSQLLYFELYCTVKVELEQVNLYKFKVGHCLSQG